MKKFCLTKKQQPAFTRISKYCLPSNPECTGFDVQSRN